MADEQRKECEHLEEEMRSLKKHMLESILGFVIDDSNMPPPENVSQFPNIGSAMAKDNVKIEFEDDINMELNGENSCNGGIPFDVESENNPQQLQSFVPFVSEFSAGDKEGAQVLCTSELVNNSERSSNCYGEFVNTDTLMPIESSTSKYDPWDEVKRESDIELTDEKDCFADYAFAEKLGNKQMQTESFSSVIFDVPAQEESRFEIVPSIRGRPMLISNRYKYKYLRNKADGSVSWRCFLNRCKAMLETDANRMRILKQKGVHLHEPMNDYDIAKMKEIPAFIFENSEKSNEYDKSEALCDRIKKEDYDISDSVDRMVCEGSGRSTKNEISRIGELLPRSRTLHCDICSRDFNQKKYLIRHIRSHHRNKELHPSFHYGENIDEKKSLVEYTLIHIDRKSYEYEVCERKVAWKDDLARHTRRHDDDRKRYECEICGRQMRERGNLIRHLRTHTGEKPYECEVCGKKFASGDGFTKHMRIHTGLKPHACEVCGKKFNSRWHLNVHTLIHNDEKPYECEICLKKFRQKSNLKIHLETHTRKKTHEGKICARKCGLKGELKRHMGVHTDGKPYKCEVCDKRYRRRNNLIRHNCKKTEFVDKGNNSVKVPTKGRR